jgi:hypothetical protein
MPTIFGKDEIVVLLGAGASVEAGIPASAQMIMKVEGLLHDKWKGYCDLYNYVKSAILYSRGIKGSFDGTHYNIESLVNTLDELVRGDEHALYPFIGSWNPKLLEVTMSDLSQVRAFRDEIVKRLRDEWVQLRYEDKANYYEGLHRFQREFQYPLRVFSLNYDLCVETACKTARIQTGFNERRDWEWRLFDESSGCDWDIYLYKLHGSINWTYEDGERLTSYDSVTHIETDRLAIIFGVTYKLQYLDPFLFFAYEFRRWTLDSSRVIVTIGYGFADEHINGILRQALAANSSRRLVAVSRGSFEGMTPEQIEAEKVRQRTLVKERLKLKEPDQVVWWPETAKTFLAEKLTIPFLTQFVPHTYSPFEEIQGEPESTAQPPPPVMPNATLLCPPALAESERANLQDDDRPQLAPEEIQGGPPNSGQLSVVPNATMPSRPASVESEPTPQVGDGPQLTSRKPSKGRHSEGRRRPNTKKKDA